jgi:hypothetical protein
MKMDIGKQATAIPELAVPGIYDTRSKRMVEPWARVVEEIEGL